MPERTGGIGENGYCIINDQPLVIAHVPLEKITARTI
jgi:hypothetical protein